MTAVCACSAVISATLHSRECLALFRASLPTLPTACMHLSLSFSSPFETSANSLFSTKSCRQFRDVWG